MCIPKHAQINYYTVQYCIVQYNSSKRFIGIKSIHLKAQIIAKLDSTNTRKQIAGMTPTKINSYSTITVYCTAPSPFSKVLHKYSALYYDLTVPPSPTVSTENARCNASMDFTAVSFEKHKECTTSAQSMQLHFMVPSNTLPQSLCPPFPQAPHTAPTQLTIQQP